MLTSQDIKSVMLSYWRFNRGVEYIATEVNLYSRNIADIFMVLANQAIEIEVKVSPYDFLADFNKEKHMRYNNKCLTGIVPNKFYFAIPKGLEIDTSILEQYPKYGLITVKDNKTKTIDFVRRAKPLHDGSVSEKTKKLILCRMSSEIANLHEKIVEIGRIDTNGQSDDNPELLEA